MSSKRARNASLAAWTLAGLLGLLPGAAFALENMMAVTTETGGPICADSSATNTYFIEALGFRNGFKVCEVIVNPAAVGLGFGMCTTDSFFTADRHAPRITLRNAATYAPVGQPIASTTTLTAWAPTGGAPIFSPPLRANLPVRGPCPATTVTIYSFGFNTP